MKILALVILLIFRSEISRAQGGLDNQIQTVIATTCGQFRSNITANQKACRDASESYKMKYPVPMADDNRFESYKVGLAEGICSVATFVKDSKNDPKTACLKGALLAAGGSKGTFKNSLEEDEPLYSCTRQDMATEGSYDRCLMSQLEQLRGQFVVCPDGQAFNTFAGGCSNPTGSMPSGHSIGGISH